MQREIHYKINWRTSSVMPGHHASRQRGGGLTFRNHAPLLQAQDPRRFDARATLRDPFEQLQIRVYQQTSSIPLYVVADLSASMKFTGAHSKRETIADFITSASYSAYRTGDSFGFVGCGEAIADSMILPATLNRSAGSEMAEQVRRTLIDSAHAHSLVRAADFVGMRRALVFVLSDFHFSSEQIAQVMESLAYHDVIPVVLWDRDEFERLPRFGFARVWDAETRQSRLLFMRTGLRQRIAQAYAQRRAKLEALFARFDRRPLWLQDGFNPDEVTNYFFG